MNDAFGKLQPPLHIDQLEGAQEIAKFLWGPKASRKRAYRAIERGLPVSRIGNRIYARRSVIRNWIEQQEKKSASRSHMLPEIPR